MRYLLISLLCLLFCTACHTTSTTTNENEKENVKLSTAKINVQLGMAYLQQNEVSRAKQKFLMALQQAPNSPEPWYSMAYFLEATGDKQKAEVYYKKAIAIAPQRGDAHNNYGTYLCRTRHYQEAIDQFLQAANNINYLDAADAYENAGLCSLKIPNKQLAAQYFEKALMQDPTRSVSLERLASLRSELEKKRG